MAPPCNPRLVSAEAVPGVFAPWPRTREIAFVWKQNLLLEGHPRSIKLQTKHNGIRLLLRLPGMLRQASSQVLP